VYHQTKGLGETSPHKGQREKYLLPEQVAQIIRAIDEDENTLDALKARDRAIIYFGFHLGLRVGEVGLLTKHNFRTLDEGAAMIPTLKKSPRIAVTCKDCSRRFRVAVVRIGSEYPCPRCSKPIQIEGTKVQKKLSSTPEYEIPIPEATVRQFIKDYLESLPEGQDHLFISRPDSDDYEHSPLVEGSVSRIFGSWIIKAGLSNKYSFHSLRHGRGVQLYDATKDLKFVQTCLRHDNTATSEIYVHLSPENVARFSGELEKRALAAN
jgi:integrase